MPPPQEKPTSAADPRPFLSAAALTGHLSSLFASKPAGAWFLFAECGMILAVLITAVLRTTTLMEVDSYYHVGVANIILKHGFISEFPWTQFSLMKEFYADKDLLLHLLILPFAFLIKNPITAGKCALIFMMAGSLAAMACLLRKYVNGFVAGILLILLFTSPVFSNYFLYLRPGTLAAFFTIAGIYFMIEKRHWWVFAAGVLFSLSHISSFTLIYFAVMCETVRWFQNREFHARNIAFAFAGVTLGILIHPNFPNNMLTIYLNAFLTPYYAAKVKFINFAGELAPNNTKKAFIENFPVFAGLAIFMLTGFWQKFRQSATTAIYTCAAGTYVLLAFSSNRFWYPAEPLAVIAIASLIADYTKAPAFKFTAQEKQNILLIGAFLLCAACFSGINSVKHVRGTIARHQSFNSDYENAARWMAKNIPPGETVYHTVWGDSPYFICLNPANRYINVLDPIYTYYWSKDIQLLMQSIEQGNYEDPYTVIKDTFKARYGFTRKQTGFYDRQLRKDNRFRIVYESADSVIFELKPETKPDSQKKNPQPKRSLVMRARRGENTSESTSFRPAQGFATDRARTKSSPHIEHFPQDYTLESTSSHPPQRAYPQRGPRPTSPCLRWHRNSRVQEGHCLDSESNSKHDQSHAGAGKVHTMNG